MSLTRSSTSRSKSRSPALSSTSPSQAVYSPQSFLTPSRYAAAATMPYASPSRSANAPQNNSPTSPAYKCSSPPSSSQTESSLSDSSFEFKPAGDFRYRVLDPGQQSLLAKRSQLGNLSRLEAQLLPSLRDTIDRMTRPPSRATRTTEILHPSLSSNFDLHPIESSHPGSPSLSSFSTTTTSSASLSPRQLSQPPFLEARSSSTSTTQDQSLLSFRHRSAPSSPTRTLSAIPTLATKHKTQSALKPVSRTPSKTSPALPLGSPSPSPVKVAVGSSGRHESEQVLISTHATIRETEDKAEFPRKMEKSKV
jgi:hypothetical protein